MIYGTEDFARLLKQIIKDDLRHPLYEKTVEHAEAMGVHICGEKPVYLLERARPREDEEVKTYRLENYEPTTKAGADKAIDIVSKVFNPTLSSIVWKQQNEQTKKLQGYTLEYYPIYNSVVSFDKDVLLRKMLADPNAVIAEKPEFVPDTDTQMIKPVSVIYGCASVWWYDRDCFLMFLRKEIEDGQEYYYFAYYDKTQYAELEVWYTDNDKLIHFDEVEFYTHDFNEIPAWFLRGKSKSMDNGEIMYESFFSSALPHWNLAVIHESDLLGAFITHMHPHKYELTSECGHEFKHDNHIFKCINGVLKGVGGISHDYNGTDCPSCSGTGRKAVTSPYGTYQFNMKKLDEGQVPSSMLPVGFITIPVDATKMLQERTQEMNNKALWSINMDVEDKVGENQSGVAKVIDRSAQHDTLYTIASVIFDVHLTNQYYFKNKYMFAIQASSENKKEDVNLPEINKPTQFDVLTTAERLSNLELARKAGLNKNILRYKEIEAANRDFSTSPDVRRYVIALLELDPLYGFTQDEINLGVSQGVIRKTDWTIHENLKPFLDRAIEANPVFLTLKQSEQLPVLEGFANELIKSEKPKIDPDMIVNPDLNAAA